MLSDPVVSDPNKGEKPAATNVARKNGRVWDWCNKFDSPGEQFPLQRSVWSPRLSSNKQACVVVVVEKAVSTRAPHLLNQEYMELNLHKHIYCLSCTELDEETDALLCMLDYCAVSLPLSLSPHRVQSCVKLIYHILTQQQIFQHRVCIKK